MFSFMKIATFATLAFGALASAMPQPAAAAEARELAARQAPTDITGVLNNLNTALQADGGPVPQLNALTAPEATAENVGPIVNNIVGLLQGAYNDCQGKPAGSGNLLVIISVTITLVINACGRVYNLPGVSQAVLIIIFQLIDSVLASLISLVFGVLGGLVALLLTILLGLLSGVTVIILQLNLTACISVLGLL